MLRGEPIDLEFLGWRSNTYDLQRAGWQIAESRTRNDYRMGEEWRLAIRHPDYAGLSGMSQDMGSILRSQRYAKHRHQFGERIMIHMELGIPLRIREMRPMQFYAVDTMPVYQDLRPQDLFHMPYFQPIKQKDTKDIYLEQASVEEIMQIALDKQNPKAMELRAKQMAQRKRDEYRAGDNIAARIMLAA